MPAREVLPNMPDLPGPPADLQAAVEAWLAADPDPATRAELAELRAAGDWAALAERFAGRLSFGTAGLRAELGAGPMRMNRLVVRQAAAGLGAYLAGVLGRAPQVVIGFDARHQSDVFAADSAAVLAASGARVVLLDRPLPTPVLAFAIRHLGADAGVMVTASHNPARDNGYKVYLGDGAQIIPPVDGEIAAAISQAALGPVPLAPLDGPAISRDRTADVLDAYVDAVVGQRTEQGAASVEVVYTPMHGVGRDTFAAVWERAGLAPAHVVARQAEPDPDFPTVAFPNPEEPGALDLALEEAARLGADVVLANDPDADRLGVAIPEDGQWRQLTGNEVGALLADHLLRNGQGGPGRLVVTTVVSSRLLAKLAAAHRVHYAETLTGFKWIVRPSLAHPEWRFTFGYEEALGYSVGPAVRDKDGISAALLFAELTAGLVADGSSPARRLEELARAFGLHATRQWSLRFDGNATSRGPALMAGMRNSPPQQLAGSVVRAHRDLANEAGTHPTDALLWDLSDGSRVIVRPSGTEPKLKVYLEVIVAVGPGPGDYAAARRDADRRLSELQDSVGALVGQA